MALGLEYGLLKNDTSLPELAAPGPIYVNRPFLIPRFFSCAACRMRRDAASGYIQRAVSSQGSSASPGGTSTTLHCPNPQIGQAHFHTFLGSPGWTSWHTLRCVPAARSMIRMDEMRHLPREKRLSGETSCPPAAQPLCSCCPLELAIAIVLMNQNHSYP